MKTLAIDFGERRVGLAVSDPSGQISMPLATIERRSDSQVISELAKIASEERIELMVVGEPRRLDGSVGEAARRAASFAEKLQLETGLPYLLVNECLTSREAERRLREAGIDPRKQPGRIDALAAQILLDEVLQGRLDSER
jgi:putative Holliday junction resolvase